MPELDLCVVGGGSAGLPVAACAAALGWNVALFERDRLGGRALHGAARLNALRRAADTVHAIRRAGEQGIAATDWTMNWDRVRAAMDRAVEDLAPDAEAARFRGMGIEVVHAPAYFTAPDALSAAGRVWRFRRCLLATGSAPAPPTVPGIAEVPFLSHDTLPVLDAAPGHLLVLGDDARSLEVAQNYRRLACLVTLIAPGSLLPAEDPELVSVLRGALRREGVVVMEGHGVVRAEHDPVGVALLLADGRRVTGSHLFVSGRMAPRTEALDLALGGVAAGPDGIEVRPDLRSTSNRRVWAAGSVAAPAAGATGPGAGAEHLPLLVRSMIFHLPARPGAGALPSLAGTDPGLLRIGPTTAPAGGLTLRATVDGPDGPGLVKLCVDRRGRLLGAGLAVREVAPLAPLLRTAVRRNLPVSELMGGAASAEGAEGAIRRAAGDFYAAAMLGSRARKLAAMLRILP